MALRNEDKAWIASQIRLATERPEVHGFKRFLNWLREWSLVGTAVTVFVGLLALTGAAWYNAFSRVDKEARFEQSTTDSLNRINDALKLIPVQIATAKYSSLSPQELKSHSNELKAIKATLASADQKAPDYWPISFQIINLLSVATSYISNTAQEHSTIRNVSGISVTKNGDVVLLMGEITNSRFEDSVIQFDPSVKLKNVTFKNCVFILPVETNPPDIFKKIGNTLLASDISNVTITAS